MTEDDRAEHFIQLLAEHERRLAAYVMTFVSTPADADDILQETKMWLWRSFDQFEAGTSFGAWARRAAFYRIRQFFRKRGTESKRLVFSDDCLEQLAESKLSTGQVKIDRGLATIRFASEAEVTLESSAELEIKSPLSGRLLAGTAVVEVPDSAHGFALTTPTAIAIDHGTAFAVTVDTTSQTSSIEVLDSEVEVKPVASDASLRLTEKQRVTASTTQLSDSAVSTGEANLLGSKPSVSEQTRLHRITTADGRGGDASVSRSRDEDVRKNSHSELVLIKNPYGGYERFGRKGYFRFDLASLPGAEIASAKFALTLMPSGLGFASKVGDCEFVVYGLTDESRDHWSDDQPTWKTAPANLDGADEVDASRVRELGRFAVRRGVQHGQVSIEGNELLQFLNADSNQSVTLMVVRETRETEPGGLVHGFINQLSIVRLISVRFGCSGSRQDFRN